MFHFTEYPGASDASATDHETIYSIIVETLFAYFGRGHIAVADNGDMYPGIIFYLTDQCPVRFAGVHLGTGTAMDGKGGDATILQLFGQINDYFIIRIPPQTCFNRNRNIDGFYYFFRYFKHQRNVPEHTGSGTFACHFLDRTTEVDIQYIRTGSFAYFGSFHHCIYFFSIYLDSDRTFIFGNGQFFLCLVYAAYQGVARYKFRINHISTEALTHQTERDIRYIFHRCQEYRAFT